LLKHKSKRLQTTQAQKQEVSYAQAHTQETSYAQAQKQGTSNQTKLHRKMFEVWTLDIQSVVFTNINQIQTLKTLE